MRRALPVLLCLVLSACMAKNQASRYVPPAEAAWYRFKRSLPEEGRQSLPGSMAAAVQLAARHFFPENASLPPGADAVDICIRQRQPWDVEVAPWTEGVMLVHFSLGPGTCQWGRAPLLDMGATYAVDVHNGRIVAIQSPLAPPEETARFEFPSELPQQGLMRIEGNVAAAIELAMEDFLDPKARVPAGTPLEQQCLSRPMAYEVTAVPETGGVVLVRFDVDDEVCPPPGTPDLVEGRKVLSPAFVTTYAIDIRTMRILGIQLTTRQRIVE
jgi:hypothetical protein